jgi:hypothetical protein
MGAVLAFIGFLSVAVLTTVYGVLMVFSPEQFRRFNEFLNPNTKRYPWVYANLHGFEYKIAGVILAFAGLAFIYLLLSRGL